MRAAMVSVLAAGTLVGCMTGGLNLPRSSAHAIFPTPNPDSVRISDLHHSVTTAQWTRRPPAVCTTAPSRPRSMCRCA